MFSRAPRSSHTRWLVLAAAITALAVAGVGAQSAGAAINSCSGTGASFAGGAGTTANPYLVSNQAQLEAIRTSTYVSCAFRQTADIALTGAWTPIGEGQVFPVNKNFTGEYDGNNKLISGLSLTTDYGYSGLFGYTQGALIQNIRLSGTVNIPGGFGVGALVGLADRPTTIINVHSSVNVTSGSRVGGLVGWLAESNILRSSSTGQITGNGSSIGGLAGFARSSFGSLRSDVLNSYFAGTVTGSANSAGVGGLIGGAEISGGVGYGIQVVNSYATGLISGGTSAPGTSGGLIGPASGGGGYTGLTVTDSFWDTETTGKTTSANNLGTGKTTAQMKSFSTFSGAAWSISDGWSDPTVLGAPTWGICNGSSYPFLNSQFTSSPCAPPPPPPTNILAVSKTGSGEVVSFPRGINCGSRCAAAYTPNTAVRLAADPAPGYSFTGWSGGTCSGTGVCEVTLSRDTIVVANFTRDSYQLTVSKQGTGTGTVVSSPSGIDCGSTCGAAFAEDTPVTLTASTSQGSAFTGWSGACSGTAPCQVTMDQARQVTATFTLPEPPFSDVRIELNTSNPAKVPASQVVRAVRVSCEGDAPCRIAGASAKARAGKGKSRRAPVSFPTGEFSAGTSRVVEAEIPTSVYNRLKKGKKSGSLTVEVRAKGTEGLKEKTLKVGLER